MRAAKKSGRNLEVKDGVNPTRSKHPFPKGSLPPLHTQQQREKEEKGPKYKKKK